MVQPGEHSTSGGGLWWKENKTHLSVNTQVLDQLNTCLCLIKLLHSIVHGLQCNELPTALKTKLKYASVHT